MNFTDLEKCKDITEEQVKIYSIVEAMGQKKIVLWVAIIAFGLVLGTFFSLIFGWVKSDWQTKTITGFLDAVIGNTMYPLVKHYFPAEKIAKQIEKLRRK